MEVRAGWNTKYGEKKFDVTFQEVDLLRLLAQEGIPPDLAIQLRPAEAFTLLQTSADLAAKVALVLHMPSSGRDPDFVAEQKALQIRREEMVARIKQRLHLEEE